MKLIAFLLIAMAFPAGALAQPSPQPLQPLPAQSPSTLPENAVPAPATTSPMWERIEHLPHGEKIKISYGSGPWEHCRFAGATDAYLFCEPGEDSRRQVPYQVNRASIADFKEDHDARNGRLIFTSLTVGTGLWLGIRTANTTHSPDTNLAGVLGGMAGAGLGALVGLPMSCLSGHCVGLPVLELPSAQPIVYGIGYNLPLRPFRRRMH